MPDPASLIPTSSPLSGVMTGGTVAANQPTDSGVTGGFQATLARQTAADRPEDEAQADPAQDAVTQPALGLPLTLAAALALSGNGNLPQTGKILPVTAAADAATTDTVTASDSTTVDPALAIDPALMLILNAVAQPDTTQPVPSPTARSAAPAANAAAAAIAFAASPATAAASQGAPAQAPAAQLAVSADPAKARAANATTITIAPDASADEATAPAANTVELRPVALAANGAQPKAQDDAAGQQAPGHDGASPQSSASPDPLALAATEDARLAPSPTPGQAEASASAAQPSLSGATTGGAVNPIDSAKPAAGTDMAALVDRLVEARQAARMSGPQSVVASIAHADFGRVSLNFRQDEGGMSVAMASNDPTFAPAAQAALAIQASQINAASTGNDTNANSNQSSGHQPDRRDGFLAQSNAGQSSPESGNQQQPRSGDSARWASGNAIAANTAPASEDTATTLSRRSGILA